MSIASMSDAKLERVRATMAAADDNAQAPAAKAAPALSATNDVARWIPTEAIALYLAFYTGIFGSTIDLATTDFSSRWRFFAVFGIGGTTFLVVLVHAGKSRQSNTPFKWPLFEMVVSDLAFAAWALALPAAPIVQWSHYGDWFPIAVVLLATSLIPLIAAALGKSTPTYDKATTDPPPPAPPAPVPA
jgi:hypothetical protein